jgi:FAD:protein FMN transferase
LLPRGRRDELLPSSRSATSDAIELVAGCRVRFHAPGLTIDLGGIAKGFAVDRAIETLRAHGLSSGVVNAGGDLAAFGPTPETICIRDPRDPRRLLCQVALRDHALASTTGSFDPFASSESTDCAIIDPQTQAPARAVRGATVRASSCMIADALTKVVMVAGERAGPLLDLYQASALLVSRAGDVYVTTGWEAVRLAA